MPAAPSNFTVVRIGIDHFHAGVLTNKPALHLAWANNAPGATHRIQRLRVGVSGWSDRFRAGDGQSVAIIHGLALSGTYRFRIRSENPDGSFSAWLLLNVDPIVLPLLPTAATQIDPPTNLAVAQNDYHGVLLTWDDNAENESHYILNVEGPGLPLAGINLTVDHLFSGSKNLPLGYPLLGYFPLRFSSTYTAKIQAVGGKQTKAANSFRTDWTAEVTFITAAEHIAIVNLPIPDHEMPVVSRGEPFNFRIETNIPGTLSIVGGALPASLALTGDMISGTTTDVAGIYEISIRATDRTTDDTQPLKLAVTTPAFNFRNLPASATAWLGASFLFRLLTNTPASAITHVAGSMPAGLAFAGDTISGTSLVPTNGDYPLTFRAENVLGSTDTRLLTINARVPFLVVLLKPHGSTSQPKPGPDWEEVAAPLASTFDWDVSVKATGPITTAGTVEIENAPPWLSVSGLRLVGTPDESGAWDVRITFDNGTPAQHAETTLRIRTQAVQITSANELTVHQDEPFQFLLTSLPPRAHFSSDDDLPPVIEVFSPEDGDAYLRGTAREVGEFTFQLDATLGHDQDSQDFKLRVLPLITLGDGTWGDNALVEGWQGDPLLEELIYHGPCEVEAWYLSGAPPGVQIGSLGCPGIYADSHNIVAITGIPGASGFFDAMVTAHVCCNGVPALHRMPLRFAINGGLFLAWLHEDRTLYDLQFQIRGDVPHRRVQSWYQREARGASTSSSTTKDTSTPGIEKTTASETTEPAVTGNILTAKRGDHLRLAILIRDGRKVLGASDGVSNVAIAFRLPDSADEEYLFNLEAAPATRNGHEFFLATLAVTQELLDELMGDDNVAGEQGGALPVETLAEIRCTYDGMAVSSAAFLVTFVEDVAR